MLQKLREKTSGWIATAILGLLIVPFAFFGMESYMSQRVDTYVARIAQPPSWWASAPQVWPITYLWKIEDIDAETYKERLETARLRMRAQQGSQKHNSRRIMGSSIRSTTRGGRTTSCASSASGWRIVLEWLSLN